MLVKVEMTLDTEDYGEAEFRQEIEKLIADIDEDTELIDFRMYEV